MPHGITPSPVGSGSAKGLGSVLLASHKQHTEALEWLKEMRQVLLSTVPATVVAGAAPLLELESLLWPSSSWFLLDALPIANPGWKPQAL